jgi:hypothetical protein
VSITGRFVVSVLIVSKFFGDTDAFRRALTERADDLRKFGERSRTSGAIHHRFGVGDGFVLVVDEWASVDQFQAFMANPELQAFVAEVGAAGQPEVTVCQAVDSPDQF